MLNVRDVIYFVYVAEFSNVPAAGSQTVPLNIDTNTDFIADELHPSFQLNGAYLSAIDGTPLAINGNVISGSTIVLPTLAHLRGVFFNGSTNWQGPTQNGVRLDVLKKLGTPYLLSKPVLEAGTNLSIQVYNDGPAPVKGQIVFIGRRTPKGYGANLAGMLANSSAAAA